MQAEHQYSPLPQYSPGPPHCGRDGASGGIGGAGASEWVIANADTPKTRYKGRPRRKARNWFEPAVAKTGLAGIHWHDLRHTFASRLMMAGVGLHNVQERMGHRTIQMTCRYAHLAPEHGLEPVERLVDWGRSGAMRIGTTASTSASEPKPEAAAVAAQAKLVQ